MALCARLSTAHAFDRMSFIRGANLTDEIIVVLDNATEETKRALHSAIGDYATYLDTGRF